MPGDNTFASRTYYGWSRQQPLGPGLQPNVAHHLRETLRGFRVSVHALVRPLVLLRLSCALYGLNGITDAVEEVSREYIH